MGSKKSSLEEPNLGDDPEATIQEILKIMDRLRTKLLPSHTLTTSRSFDAEINKRKENLQLVPIACAVSTGQEGTPNVFLKLQLNLRLLKESVSKVQQLHQDVGDEVRKHLAPLEKLLQLVNASETQLTKSMEKNLEDINKKIFNMMFQVPLLPNNLRKPKGSHSQDEYYDRKHFRWLYQDLTNEELQERHTVLRQVRDKFEKLSSTHLQDCLLSFAVFPENEEVHRTMLMYWWIGEGILPDQVKPEDAVKDILKELTEESLIEPVENKRKLEPVSYKMAHFVHLSVVHISKELGLFDIDDEEEEDPTIRKSTLNKVCLIEGSSSLPGATKMAADSIETVFNVSEMFPEFALKWFSKQQPSQKKKMCGRLLKTSYKSLKVFYLGRWERTPNRHIEVGSPKLMKYLKHMTKLRLLSFQGISKIETLNRAICKLPELIVLDLRACYSLEKLPDKISSLKNLTYLDMSGCYMIDRMPKTLSWLDNLEVLKGFVVSDATCKDF